MASVSARIKSNESTLTLLCSFDIRQNTTSVTRNATCQAAHLYPIAGKETTRTIILVQKSQTTKSKPMITSVNVQIPSIRNGRQSPRSQPRHLS